MTTRRARSSASSAHAPIDEDWLGRRCETALGPDIPIIDPHHHLWDQPGSRYLIGDVLADIGAGHDVRATVFVECHTMYRADGPEELRPAGETSFVNGIASAGAARTPRVAAGIVAFADLRRGDEIPRLLEAHRQAAPERLRGIRQRAAWHESPQIGVAPPAPSPHLLSDPDFRAGFGHLAAFGLSFDAWVFHTQLGELVDLAWAFPDTRIVLNHAGGPIGIGPYCHRRAEVFAAWKAGMVALARCRNVYVKLGGLGMRLGGFAFEEAEVPPSSADLAVAWRPYLETCIELFGSRRCMFESNFPVDKGSCSYVTLWNAFKIITSACSASEHAYLFAGTAAEVYSLGEFLDTVLPI